LHFQAEPHGEAKLVRATRGAVFDVAVDVRPDSATFGAWVAFELSQDNRLALYIPSGCAHGMQTLVDHTEVFYQMSSPYQPGAGRGVRWDDPALGIAWPLAVSVMSKQDTQWPDLGTHFPAAVARAA
jgi:dTDP-4-dehydrorhamnose 3,5-epimerase